MLAYFCDLVGLYLFVLGDAGSGFGGLSGGLLGDF